MSTIEELTEDYVAKSIRSKATRANTQAAKADLHNKCHEEVAAMEKALDAHKNGSPRDKVRAGRDWIAAEEARIRAFSSLRSKEDAANRNSGSHAEAYRRLMAAQKEAGPTPETPFEYQFAETVSETKTPMQRSASKRHKFQSPFDHWRRDVDEAFANYATMRVFPSPPGRCRGGRCLDERKKHTCRCVIQVAFAQVENLELELKRWHPDKFAVCGRNKKVFQEMAAEIFAVVAAMVAKQNVRKSALQAARREVPKTSLFSTIRSWFK